MWFVLGVLDVASLLYVVDCLLHCRDLDCCGSVVYNGCVVFSGCLVRRMCIVCSSHVVCSKCVAFSNCIGCLEYWEVLCVVAV